MGWEWLTVNKLIDPSTGMGALALALVVFAFAWLVSLITSRLLQRPVWATGKLKQRVDQTVVRYLMRLKNLIIFLIAIFIYASLYRALEHWWVPWWQVLALQRWFWVLQPNQPWRI